ncbi:TetR/AcrR family transcriptional regulator [Microcoleus sp.]|uniref:TetR/AcrR family transcriptional regulator n=1 Tax=Microcoleus sp. TaxID=44472 RepID=UPI003525CAA5
MTDSPQSTPLWRIPQQARSWERFHSILDAAAELFVEIGYESVTTDEIAARANTSVGGLYRFFPDKLAIFHALLDRYLNQLRELSATLHTEEAMQVTLDVYVNQLVDGFDQFVSANPGFRPVFLQSRLISTTIAMSAAFYQELAQQFTVYFATRNPALEQSHRELIATISVEVACTLDILAVSRDRTFQHQVLTETKKLLIAYLGQYFPDRS